MATISIIIPSYNDDKNLKNLYAQFTKIQSNKYKLQIISINANNKYENKQQNYLNLKKNKNHQYTFAFSEIPCRALQMNLGSEKANGEILLFLHSDTKINKTHLDKLYKKYQKSKNKNHFFGCYTRTFTHKSYTLKVTSFLATLRAKFLWMALGDQAIFINTQLFNKINKYRKMTVLEDLDLALRVKYYLNCKAIIHFYKFTLISPSIKSSPRRYKKNGIKKQLLIDYKIAKNFVKISRNIQNNYKKSYNSKKLPL